MDKGRLEEFRQMLETMKHEIEANIERLNDEIDLLSSDEEDFGDMDDEPMLLSDEIDHIALLKQQRHELDEVNHALAKIENGTYGICESSGREIRLERLRVAPQARYCMEEAEKLEAD